MNDLNHNTPKLYNPKANAPAIYIPAWLSQISSKLLTATSKMVYGRLAQWATSSGKAHRSAKQLSEELGMPSRTVEQCLKELRDKKLIGSFVPRNGGHNHFEFYDHPWMHEEINKNLCYQSGFETPSAKSAAPSAKSAAPSAKSAAPSAKSAVHKIKEIKEIKTTTTVKPDKPKEPKQSSSSFFEEVLNLKPESDIRSDEIFLEHVEHHIKNNSDKNLNIHRRRSGIITILKRLFESNEVFYSDGYVDQQTKQKIKQENEAKQKAFLEAQDRQHAKRIASYQGNRQHA